MQEEVFPAAEKILSDIENVFKKDLNLASFEIIPAEDNENKSPVFHEENSLGLATWCIQPLYCYVYNRLLDLRQNYHRREEPTTISRWLLGALLLNPDMSTFWNMRRELMRNGRLDPLQELRFVNVVLYHKAKCFEAFSYRRWLLKLILIENKEPTHDVDTLLHNEIQITTVAANRYGNNCHAWSHREQILSMLEALSTGNFNSFLENEWEESTRWCNLHISDYSGFSYRQFLLKRLLLRKYQPEQHKSPQEIQKRRDIIIDFVKTATRGCNDVFLLRDETCKDVLDLLHGAIATKGLEKKFEHTMVNLSYWAEDCIINEELINNFPGHDALWYHRRFLVFSMIALNNSYKNFFSYKTDSLNSLQTLRSVNENSKVMNKNMSQSLLEIAFCSKTKQLVDEAKRFGSYHNYLAERFCNYLAHMKINMP